MCVGIWGRRSKIAKFILDFDLMKWVAGGASPALGFRDSVEVHLPSKNENCVLHTGVCLPPRNFRSSPFLAFLT